MDITFPDPKITTPPIDRRIFSLRGYGHQALAKILAVEELTERGKISKRPRLGSCNNDVMPVLKEIVILDSTSTLQKEVRKAEVARRAKQESVIYYSVVLSYFVVCLVVLWVSLFFVLS